MGSRSPFQRQRAGKKKGETATAAEENPSWEAPGQGLQGGHGSRSGIVRPSRLQIQGSALMWEKPALAPRRADEAKWEQHKGCKPYLCCDSWCALQEVSCTLYRATNISLSCFFLGTGGEIKMTSASLLLSSILFWELPNHFKTHKYNFKAIIIFSFLKKETPNINVGQSRGFYQGRNPEFFLHKNVWEIHEFVPPVPIITTVWWRKAIKSSVVQDWFHCCWLVHTTDQRLYQNQSTDHLWLLKIPFPTQWPTGVTGHLNITVQSFLSWHCVGPTLHLSHVWFPNSLFQKFYLYLRL